jgi:hypothetical protein
MRNNTLRNLSPESDTKGSDDFGFDSFGEQYKFYAAELDWMPVTAVNGDYVCAFTYSPGGVETDIYLYFYNANKYTKLTDQDVESESYQDNKDSHPTWSPGGMHLAFESDRDEGNGDIFILMRVDLFLKDSSQFHPRLYRVPGNPEYPDFGIAWNPKEETGLIAFTTKVPVGLIQKNFYKIRVFSLPDSQSVVIAPGKEEDNFQPSWDPHYGSRVAYFVGTYDKDLIKRGSETEQKLNINIRRIYQDSRLALSDSAISTLSSIGRNVVYDGRNGPIWLLNSDFLLFTRFMRDGDVPLYYGDLEFWMDGTSSYLEDISSPVGYTRVEQVFLSGSTVTFKQQEGNKHYIVVARIGGEFSTVPEQPEYNLMGHARYDRFLAHSGPVPPRPIWSKLTIDPVGGKDLVINRPVVALGTGALIFLLSGSNGGTPSTYLWNPPQPPAVGE